jgi:hypothetical protein
LPAWIEGTLDAAQNCVKVDPQDGDTQDAGKDQFGIQIETGLLGNSAARRQGGG